MRSSLALGVTGFSLIAVTYGLARFSWGLMMPAVSEEIPFSVHLAGILTACSYLSYCMSTAAAPGLVARFGASASACLAALCAAGGLLLLACAVSPLMLAAGLFIAGLSAGVASPAVASAVGDTLPPAQQDPANTAINAGTSAGIMLSVPVLMLLPGGWRAACVLFALLALICLLPARRYLPKDRRVTEKDRLSWRDLVRQRSLLRLGIVAFISGSASAAWWSFGPEILRNYLHLDGRDSSLLWLISGGAGIAGALTGLARRWLSMAQIYRLSQVAMALPLLLLASLNGFSWWLFPAVALGGAGYVTLSGVLLVYGAAATPASAASGVGVAFFMLAAGQVAGSALFGAFYAGLGAGAALLGFAALALAMAAVLPGAHKA
ncbi:MFS transporter [Pantoea latae]|uniref:MFS transporter n=1 Tax=Pantoea latae TaxID=1964541 RepID=A0A1V9DGJ1_9GAMM|nr:MFS transporter [Pantoea latae]OQP32987.1 MFS transporter [Pantoea latae]